MAENSHFAVDERCEKFLMAWHPGGYLRRRNAADFDFPEEVLHTDE